MGGKYYIYILYRLSFFNYIVTDFSFSFGILYSYLVFNYLFLLLLPIVWLSTDTLAIQDIQVVKLIVIWQGI